jgi:uncharacterized MAPEG superfamily protein
VTADLRFLAFSALLCVAQALPYSHGIMLRPEVMKGGLGDRGLGEGLTGWASRARRSHVNMVETLVPFAALVLSAHLLGRVSVVDVLGVEVFFAARLLHVVAALAGIAWLRKVAWHTSLFGVALVALALFLPT